MHLRDAGTPTFFDFQACVCLCLSLKPIVRHTSAGVSAVPTKCRQLGLTHITPAPEVHARYPIVLNRGHARCTRFCLQICQ
jgi:hypothetical protein